MFILFFFYSLSKKICRVLVGIIGGFNSDFRLIFLVWKVQFFFRGVWGLGLRVFVSWDQIFIGQGLRFILMVVFYDVFVGDVWFQLGILRFVYYFVFVFFWIFLLEVMRFVIVIFLVLRLFMKVFRVGVGSYDLCWALGCFIQVGGLDIFNIVMLNDCDVRWDQIRVRSNARSVVVVFVEEQAFRLGYKG